MTNLINSTGLNTTTSVIDTLTPRKNMTNNQMHAPHLVVIDAAVDDRKFLIKGVLPDADVMVLDRHRDGIAQISVIYL